jgi:ribonuclease J
LATTLGVNENNILIPEIGSTVELSSKSMKFGEPFKAGTRLVDGIEIDGSDSVVLRDRIHISEDGIMVVVVCKDMLTGQLVSTEIINKGIVIGDDTLTELSSLLSKSLDGVDLHLDDGITAKNHIRRSLKNYVFKKTKKNPMILPIIMEV